VKQKASVAKIEKAYQFKIARAQGKQIQQEKKQENEKLAEEKKLKQQ
jgi:hypothetical protein